jgi:Leucine-rich repeat (LRR) protein
MRCYDPDTAQANAGQVVELYLHQRNLREVPAWITKCVQLEVLDLSGNSLPELPAFLADLPALKRLRLSHNQLPSLPDRMPQGLLELDLSHNLFQRFPKSILGLLALQILKIGHNKLGAWPKNLHLPQLQVLELQNNRLKNLEWEAKQFPRLDKLNLHSNQLQHLDLNGVWEKLAHLDLGKNRLTEMQRGHFPYLRRLFLGQNKLAKLSDTWQQCSWLQTLVLAQNQLQELPTWLQNLTRLENLDLAQNPLKTLEAWPPKLRFLSLAKLAWQSLPPEMATLQDLVELDLSGNALQAFPSWLGTWSKLEKIQLKNCNPPNGEWQLLQIPELKAVPGWRPGSEQKALLQVLNLNRRKPLSTEQSLLFFHILAGKTEQIKTLHLADLMRGLNAGMPLLQEAIKRILLKNQAAAPDLSTGSTVAFVGSPGLELKKWEQKLLAAQLKIGTWQTATFWILGKKKFPLDLPNSSTVNWLDESTLEKMLKKLSPSNANPAQDARLKRMLWQADQANLRLAINLIKTKGLEAHLRPDLLVAWKKNQDVTLAGELKSLLERYWPLEHQAVLRQKIDWPADFQSLEFRMQVQKWFADLGMEWSAP